VIDTSCDFRFVANSYVVFSIAETHDDGWKYGYNFKKGQDLYFL